MNFKPKETQKVAHDMTEVCCMQSCVCVSLSHPSLTLRGLSRGFKKEDSGPNYVTPLGPRFFFPPPFRINVRCPLFDVPVDSQ